MVDAQGHWQRKDAKNNQPLTVDTFVLEVVFDEKRLRKHKNNNKTFDNQS